MEVRKELSIACCCMLFELHWSEGRHPQCCCTTFSSIAGAQHQPHEEKVVLINNQMVSGLEHCRDAAADWSGAGWKVQHLHLQQ